MRILKYIILTCVFTFGFIMMPKAFVQEISVSGQVYTEAGGITEYPNPHTTSYYISFPSTKIDYGTSNRINFAFNMKSTSTNGFKGYDYLYFYGYSFKGYVTTARSCEPIYGAYPTDIDYSQTGNTSQNTVFAFKCDISGSNNNYNPENFYTSLFLMGEGKESPNISIYKYVTLLKKDDTAMSSVESSLKSESAKLQDSLNSLNQNQQQTNNKLDNINDTLNNGTTDSPSSSFDDFNSKLPENGVITQLVTLPVTMYQSILNSVNGTCQTFNLGNLFGTELTMPCIDISDYLGDVVWSVIDVLFSGFFIFVISRKFIAIFNQMTNMEEGDILD